MFARSAEVNQLLREQPNIALNVVAKEAGFNAPTDIPVEGLPPKCCLLWVVFGKCQFAKCQRAHPSSVDNAAATKLYNHLLPGIKAMNAKPRGN